ncbi:MAG TPA: FtsX-like permease family protein, partial [Candidatus Saccharimonadales bacterium]|nr:FtsX-like permease family protein [Candidatus Saccharimonadales bacterium]
MLWLSLRLVLQGGREALIRLIATALAVSVGVIMLLGVLSQFHALQASSQRRCWECTTKEQQASHPNIRSTSHQLLWLYRKDTYKGQDIKRLDVAALGSQAPMLPGVTRLPQSGEYYASPAMAKLLRTAPRDELGDRFPGKQIGTIANEALSSPDALVMYVGRNAAEISTSPSTFPVVMINTKPKAMAAAGNFVRFAFGVGAAGLLFPMLILIGTATRLSAARREERFAAFRLIGATPRQVNVIASIDAVIAAILGTVVGIGIFLLLRPVIADVSLFESRFFPQDVSPTMLGYGAILLGVPLAAAAAALLSLRRVRISPLGVSRKVTPAAPKVWTLLPLL